MDELNLYFEFDLFIRIKRGFNNCYFYSKIRKIQSILYFSTTKTKSTKKL